MRVAALAAFSAGLVFGGVKLTRLHAQASFTLRTVPWLGSPSVPHQVFPGGSIVLQGVATQGVTDTPQPLNSATWDPGDGSPVVPIGVGNPLALELTHTYNGSDGQPYDAILTATDTGGHMLTATFHVVVKTKTLDVEANMAIDKGLWYLHKSMTKSTNGTVNVGWWPYGGSNVASTSSAVQAFEVNNHLESGHADIDPYVHDVARGLAWLESQILVQGIGLQGTNNPDTNGNGIGLFSNNGSPDYIVGHLMDAFVASATPNATAVLGDATWVKGRKYKDIVQDMVDYNAWGQLDSNFGRGGWDYNPNVSNHSGYADNSVSQWPAIGMIAAERVWGPFGVTVPAFVKTENLLWLHASQLLPGGTYDGAYPYDFNRPCLWSDCQAATPSGMVQAIMDGVTFDSHTGVLGTSDQDRFQRALQFIAREMRSRNNFPGGALPGSGSDSTFGGQNFYAMYATTKAMRLALDSTGHPSPITTIDDDYNDATPGFNWYTNDPTHGDLGPYGVARSVIATQQADGHWNGAGNWTNPLSTEYAIIILSPSVFQIGPKASCVANPTTIGTNGGLVNFSAAASQELNPNASIVGYQWSFGDSSTGSGLTTSHTYATWNGPFPHALNVSVTVTDSNGIADTATCPVMQIDTDLPPIANIGGNIGPGQYKFCVATPMVLDGSLSSDPEDGAVSSFAWDVSAPITFSPIDAATPTFDISGIPTFQTPGTYSIGLSVTDSNNKANSQFGSVTIVPATDSFCNQPPVAQDDTASTFSGTPVTVTVLSNDSDPDAGQTLTVTLTDGGPANGSVVINGGTTITYTPNLGFAGTDIFKYEISDGHGGTARAGVTVTVTKRSATVTAGSGSKAYGTSDPTLTPTSSGFQADDNIVVTETARDGGENIGAYATHATASGALLANYDVTYVPGALTITPVTATVTAASATKVYGTADPTLTPTSSGFLPADGIVVTETARDAGENIGSYATHATASGGALANYTVTYTNGSLSITKAPATVTAGSGGKVYGTADPALAPTSSGFLPADGIVVTETARDSGETVGSYATHATASGALGNYTVSYVDGSFVISPAALSVVANNKTRIFTAPNPPLDGTLTGVVAGDGLTATYSTTAAAGSPVGAYPITPALVDPNGRLGNYTVSIVPGTLTITNLTPVCQNPPLQILWPPNHQLVSINPMSQATDGDGDSLAIKIVSIFQDEPTNETGDGNTAIDGFGVGSSVAQVRAERTGDPKTPGNGRVYYINYTATDPAGASCSGQVTVGVPHDQGGKVTPVGDGPLFDSTVATQPLIANNGKK